MPDVHKVVPHHRRPHPETFQFAYGLTNERSGAIWASNLVGENL
jgi:hypothetical protein